MEKYCRTRQAKDDNMVPSDFIPSIRLQHTLLEYIILLFCCNRGYMNLPQCYIIHTDIAYLVVSSELENWC